MWSYGLQSATYCTHVCGEAFPPENAHTPPACVRFPVCVCAPRVRVPLVRARTYLGRHVAERACLASHLSAVAGPVAPLAYLPQLAEPKVKQHRPPVRGKADVVRLEVAVQQPIAGQEAVVAVAERAGVC